MKPAIPSMVPLRSRMVEADPFDVRNVVWLANSELSGPDATLDSPSLTNPMTPSPTWTMKKCSSDTPTAKNVAAKSSIPTLSRPASSSSRASSLVTISLRTYAPSLLITKSKNLSASNLQPSSTRVCAPNSACVADPAPSDRHMIWMPSHER